MIAAALVLSSLASAAGAPRLAIDPMRVQPPAAAPGMLHRAGGSFAARYAKDGMTLHFLAAGGDLGLVKRAFDGLKFKRVVVEGRAYAAGDAASTDAGLGLRAESALALDLALKKGIPVGGAEPSEGLVLRAMLADGYAAEDWHGLRFLEAAAHARRAGADLEALFGASASRLAREAGLAKPPLTYEAFKGWYRAKNGAPFETDEIGPLTVKADELGPLFTQRAAHVSQLARDRFAARRVADELLVYGDVLVVFGPERFAAQRAAIEAALGPAVYVGSLSVVQ